MISLKKIISVVLSVAVIFCMLAPASAATSEKCTCGVNPTIYVGPLGSTDIYENPGEENERTLFRPATDTIVKLVFKLLPAIAISTITFNLDYLVGDILFQVVKQLLFNFSFADTASKATNLLRSGGIASVAINFIPVVSVEVPCQIPSAARAFHPIQGTLSVFLPKTMPSL